MGYKGTRKKDLGTLAVLAAASVVLYLCTRRPAFALLALSLLVVGLLSKTAAARIASAWMGFADILGRINSTVILGAMYFLFLTPLALLQRVFRGNRGNIRADAGTDTYFEVEKRGFTPSDLEKPW